MSALSLHNPGSVVVPEDELVGIEAKVLGFLRQDHRWVGVRFTMAEIADGIGIDSGGTCPQIRKAIRNLNMKGYPVVINDIGARLATCREDLFEYREALWQRAEKIIARAHALTQIVHSQFKQR